ELSQNEPVHEYNAEADVLSADLIQPLKETIRARARVKLPKHGHYQFKKASPFRFEGIISYHSGYTQVAGHPSSKSDGFATLVTSVLEGLNVLDVVTADRVVAQISTVHPYFGKGQVPSVTFLGTRFENLRIGGHKVEVTRNLEILGSRPSESDSYFKDAGVQSRITTQYNNIANDTNLPLWGAKEFPKGPLAVKGNDELNCSLVDGVTGPEGKPFGQDGVAGLPGTPFGHVIDVPHFGRIYLGELKVTREPSPNPKKEADKYRFRLTMIRLQMGCIAQGSASAVAADTNGRGGKGGGG
ncbi:MAG TPA: hypothetical protein VIW68_05960, partial [Candidatus Sulfotelmatobacter sp.]